MNTELNSINKPKHYIGKKGLEAQEVIDNFIRDLTGKQAHHWSSSIEYLLRFRYKNGIQDIDKAIKHLDFLKNSMLEDVYATFDIPDFVIQSLKNHHEKSDMEYMAELNRLGNESKDDILTFNWLVKNENNEAMGRLFYIRNVARQYMESEKKGETE